MAFDATSSRGSHCHPHPCSSLPEGCAARRTWPTPTLPPSGTSSAPLWEPPLIDQRTMVALHRLAHEGFSVRQIAIEPTNDQQIARRSHSHPGRGGPDPVSAIPSKTRSPTCWRAPPRCPPSCCVSAWPPPRSARSSALNPPRQAMPDRLGPLRLSGLWLYGAQALLPRGD